MKFRNELKYLINNYDFEVLKARLKIIMKPDPHAVNGQYKVNSLYFDDYKQTSFDQVMSGISKRWKWRIRYYNNDYDYICLEKKFKVNNMTNKQKVKISKQQCLDIINNVNISVNTNNEELLNEFYLDYLNTRLKPAVIVSYDRIPYLYKAGGVRITFDFNLSTSMNFDKFLSNSFSTIPLLEVKQYILEVKYNEFIPDYIRHKLSLNHLERTSYSKFAKGILMLKKRGGLND